MKRFRFTLEPLLTARRAEERRAQQVVAEFERKRVEIENAIRAIQQRLAAGRGAVRESLLGRVDLDLLREHARLSIDAARQADRLVLHLAEVHRRLDEHRQKLREAMRNRRAVELLREARWRDWQRESKRRQQNVLDDLSAARRAAPAGLQREEPA